MIDVTERAKEALKERMAREIADEVIGFRLHRNPSGVYSLLLDWPSPGDQVIEHRGAKVLLIDQDISNSLDGATIDYVDNGSGEVLLICEWQTVRFSV
jgi:Fe-S cluster assembly iron-binding protein IscA